MKRLFLPALCAALVAGCDASGPASPTAALAATPVDGSPVSFVPVTNATAEVVAAAGAAGTGPAPTLPVAAKPAPTLPAPAAEVVRLSQATLGDSVLINYIDTIQEPYSLNADQIIYLSDLGLSMPVLNALIKRGNPANVGAGVVAGAGPNPAPAAASPAAIAPAPAPAPAAPLIPASQFPGADVGAPSPGGAPVYGTPQPGAAGSPPPPGSGTVAVAAPSGPATYNVFYESLEPYGSWVEVENYGYCWRPTVAVVDSGWRPYGDRGRWLWTDYGWYWNSEYSWGWAPFHYGRWHLHSRMGWVWSPGADWGPAWVQWRYNDAHCGWAPLPPECRWTAGVGFSWWNGRTAVSVGFGLHDDWWFGIGWGDFCGGNLRGRGLPRHDIHQFVSNSSQVIHNGSGQVVNINGNNNTVIINNGVPVDRVQKHTRDEIRKVAVADTRGPDSTGLRATGGAAKRPEVAAFRPQFAPATAQPKAPAREVLARQEARKNGALPATSGTGSALPARPSANPGIAAPGNGGFVPARPGNQVAPARTATGGQPAPAGAGPSVAPAARPGQNYSNPAAPSAPSRSELRPTPAAGANSAPSRFAPAPAPAAAGASGFRQDDAALRAAPTAPRFETRKETPPTQPRSYEPAPSVTVGSPRVYEPSARPTPAPNFSAPSARYSAPAAPAPVYQRAAPAPAQSFRSEPARSYSAPAPAPAPTFRAPSPVNAQPAPSRPNNSARGNRDN